MKIRSTIAAAIVFTAALAPFSSRADILTWTYAPSSKDDHGAKTIDGVTITPTYSWVDSTETSFAWTDSSLQIGVTGKAAYGVSYSIPASSFDGGITKVTLTAKVAKALNDASDDNKSKVSVSVGGIALSPATTNLTSTAKAYEFTSETTLSGEMVLSISILLPKNNKTSYALYVQSIVVTYDDSPSGGGGDTPSGPAALATPTDLVATSVTDSGFSLSWTGDVNASGYEVKVLDGDKPSGGSVSVSGTSATVTDLDYDTTYTVRVKALAAAGSEDYVASAWSEAVPVTTTLADGLRRAEIFNEGFSGMSTTSWNGQSFLTDEGDVPVERTDRDTWYGNKLYNAPSSVRFGNSSQHGWILSPSIGLQNDLPYASVRVTFSAIAIHANALSALTFSVLDSNGNTLSINDVSPVTPTLTLVQSPTAGSTVASELANVNGSPFSYTFQAPNGFRLKFDASSAANSNIAIDDIVVTQVYDPNYATLSAPANVAVSDIGKTSFTVSWGEVTDASGYEVWLNGAMADTCESTETSITLSGLSDGTEYSVQVRALGDGLHNGDSELSAAIFAKTEEDEQKIVFAVTGAPEGDVYAGDAVSFTVTATGETSGEAAEVNCTGLADASFDAFTGTFSWTPTESDVGSHTATFTSGEYSTTVTITVVSATREETVFEENFSKITSSSWTSTSGYTTGLEGDIGTWTGLDIIKTKAAIIIGRVASAGSARSPVIGLKPGATGVSVSFETGALPNMDADASAAVKVSLLDAETGTTLATETFSNLPKLAAAAQAVSDANAHYVLSLPAGTTVPEFVAVLFESIHENSSHSGRVYIDTVVVSQTVSAKIKTLATPEDLALSGSAGENGFTVTWMPVEGATGYEVRVLDASETAAGSPSGGVSPAGTVWADLADDTTYTVQVRATGNAATHYPSAWSEAVSVTTARSALHPTLSFGAWQNEVGDGKLYASTANSATVSATLADGASGTVTSIALSSLTPAQAEGATGPTLAGGTLAWTPAEADAKKSFTLAFAVTVTPVEGEARIWTETVAVPIAALPALAAPANLAVNLETLDWNRADFTWTKPFRAVSYTLRVWSGAADPDASGTTWSEDFESYQGTPETQPSGWTFDNGNEAYKSYNGVHVGFKASGSVTSPDISGTVNSLSFNVRSVSGTTSTLSVWGWNGTEWVEMGSYTGEDLSTSTSTKTIENLAGAYNRFKWEFTKVGSNCAFGSVVLTGTGLPSAKVRTVKIAPGDTTSATVKPAAWGVVNYADVTAHDAGGASETSAPIQFSVPEQPSSVRATLMVFK